MMTGVNFIIEVLRGKKVEVERRWETDWTSLSSFKDVFLKVVPDRLKDLPVRVRIGSKKPEPNQWVNPEWSRIWLSWNCKGQIFFNSLFQLKVSSTFVLHRTGRKI